MRIGDEASAIGAQAIRMLACAVDIVSAAVAFMTNAGKYWLVF